MDGGNQLRTKPDGRQETGLDSCASHEMPAHSADAERYMGTYVPENTAKGSLYAIRDLAGLVIIGDYKAIYFGSDYGYRSYHMQTPSNKKKFEVDEPKKRFFDELTPGSVIPENVLFGELTPRSVIPDAALKKANHYMIEFAVLKDEENNTEGRKGSLDSKVEANETRRPKLDDEGKV